VGRLNDRKSLPSDRLPVPVRSTGLPGEIRPEPANSPWAVIRRAGDLAAPSIMLGMAEDADQPHIEHMKKSPRVTFKMLRIAEDDWQIVAERPGTETQYIKG
jgi:hypothetical protein